MQGCKLLILSSREPALRRLLPLVEGSGSNMAVPGRLNGLMEEDDDNDEGEEWVDLSRLQELSPELVAIATAAESGDVEGLRIALGILIGLSFSFLFGCSPGYRGYSVKSSAGRGKKI